ncbi:MAG: HD domain-containing phosphohydrolase [Thermodesulfobacteriota bacterium]
MNSDRTSPIHDFIRHSVTAISNAALYTSDHPQVGHLCAQGLTNLVEAMGNESSISFMVIDDELIHDGSPLGNSMYTRRLARALAAHGIGSVRIARDVEAGEMEALIFGLAKKGDGPKGVSSSKNIRLGKIEVRTTQPGDPRSTTDTPPQDFVIPDVSSEEMAKVMEVYEEVRKQKQLRVTGIQEIVVGIIETLRHDSTPLLALAPLRTMDEYTFTHSINVCILNLSQAMGLQVEGQLLADIGAAALLHDIGKLFIPVEVINKPGKLDEAEWALMRLHSVKGAEYLAASPEITKLAAVTAFEHHMKFNNYGYPKVPQGWKQNLCSQMTTISDIFDAMRTRRSYRKSMETREVISLMQGITGTELHPALMKNFLKILGRFSWSKGSRSPKMQPEISLAGFKIL